MNKEHPLMLECVHLAIRPTALLVAGVALAAWVGPSSPTRGDDEPSAVRSKLNDAAANFKTLKDFEVKLIYAVPPEQGSWVSMTLDPQGRLITSDQYGKLYRITLSDQEDQPPTVEPLAIDIGSAHGLLYAFDSLYVMVSEGRQGNVTGLYRARDTDGDDQFDEVELLRPLKGSGEHGPHAIVLSPDGQSLTIVAGNHTDITEFDRTMLPSNWGEDQLLPRMWDASGHAVGRLAPGGWIARVSPDGKEWTLISSGYRNPYDAAYNKDGELFTYDSDMEWDMNTPWYRPTRVNHATGGSEFGWRSGTGKWPPDYPDSLPAILNIGPGSPTGVVFGYGAKFPSKYQEALFICDWSYGKLYAVHLTPNGSSYDAVAEEFVTGQPLALTDIVVRPQDGAIYFTLGGRRTTSGLYRVRYVGSEDTTPVTTQPTPDAGSEARAQRRALEAFHGVVDPKAVETAWPFLDSPDRFLRYAARLAVESQPVETWADRALNEPRIQGALTALLALARQGGQQYQEPLLHALDRLSLDLTTEDQKIQALRILGLSFIRQGEPPSHIRETVADRLNDLYPAGSRRLDSELSKLLVYLQSDDVVAKTIDLMEKAPTQEEQIDYALALRVAQVGWTDELRERYFRWFVKASTYKGGHSLVGFIRNIKAEAVANLSEDQKAKLQPILEAKPEVVAEVLPSRPFVKEWTLEELEPLVSGEALAKGRNYDQGRLMFAAANCYSCHRFGDDGGSTGPDLTTIANRFSPRDLLESIIHPSKTISDQYEAVQILVDDGRVVTGRIVNLNNENLMINTDMLNPDAMVSIKRSAIEEILPSPISMMPEGLLNTLTQEEILDLMAFMLSRGDRQHPMFRQNGAND